MLLSESFEPRNLTCSFISLHIITNLSVTYGSCTHVLVAPRSNKSCCIFCVFPSIFELKRA